MPQVSPRLGEAQRQMRLAAFLYPTGYHVGAWRHPDVPAGAGVDIRHFIKLATLAEQACFDFLFLADSSAVRGDDLYALERTAIRYIAQFEPLTLLSALAVSTQRIGLVASVSTTYNEPYHVARSFASLDHISGGRTGWNLVTSQNPYEAYNFGYDAHPPHPARYDRAREFADVVVGLWDSWDDDAFIRDKAAGLFFRREGMHVLDHAGEHFRVRGPLNVPRSPQGRPVMVQAGSSDAGRQLAAETAELVFTAQDDRGAARAFADDVRSGAAACGRAAPLVMAGLFPFVGRTRAEAEDKAAALQDLVDPIVGLSLLAGQLGGVDLNGYALDGPVPELPLTEGGRSRQHLLVEAARRDGLSLGELCRRVAGGRGHWTVVGTAEDVADRMEEWFLDGAADGFNVMGPTLPGGLEDFVARVLPELRRRGLVRTGYEGRTLRDHLGLARPVDRATRAAAGPRLRTARS